MYKCVIASAGTGSRVRDVNPLLNKGLITLGDKPVLAHIIDRIPTQIEIVMLIGYGGSVVQDAVTALYPDRFIKFISVKPFEGPGSGLGASLMAAIDALQCPFVFTTNDTFCLDIDLGRDPGKHGNWLVGASEVRDQGFDINQYRMLSIDKTGSLAEILPKGERGDLVYTGICGVRDYQKFWRALCDHEDPTVGETIGLKSLADVHVVKTDSWYDTGNLGMLRVAKSRFKSHKHNVLEKPSEAIWFREGLVTKFCLDPVFISERVERSRSLPAALFPEVIEHSRHTYTYEYQPGSVLSSCKNSQVYVEALNQAHKFLWSVRCDQPSSEKLRGSLVDFYRKKTVSRLKDYFLKTEELDSALVINGRSIPACHDLVAKTDWQKIYDLAVFGSFHGDFHQENILYCPLTNTFSFLDYRQDFGESILWGDTYYDLAKFLHGLLVNHHSVHANLFSVNHVSSNRYEIEIMRSSTSVEVEGLFEEWARSKGYDIENIKTLTALIFLNISPLHHSGYDIFLNLYGRYLLAASQDRLRNKKG
jgi:hypothetical protein